MTLNGLKNGIVAILAEYGHHDVPEPALDGIVRLCTSFAESAIQQGIARIHEAMTAVIREMQHEDLVAAAGEDHD